MDSVIWSVTYISYILILRICAHSFRFSISYSICSFQDFRQLLDDDLELLVKLRESILNWVQEGFQDFFRELHGRFLLLSGRNNSSGQVHGVVEGTQGDRILASLVLVLAQLSVFIEQTAIQRITEANKPPFIFMLVLY